MYYQWRFTYEKATATLWSFYVLLEMQRGKYILKVSNVINLIISESKCSTWKSLKNVTYEIFSFHLNRKIRVSWNVTYNICAIAIWIWVTRYVALCLLYYLQREFISLFSPFESFLSLPWICIIFKAILHVCTHHAHTHTTT